MVNYYFIANLTEEQRRKLDNARIVYTSHTIGDVSGFVIDVSDKDRMITALNATISSEEENAETGITKLNLRFRSEVRPLMLEDFPTPMRDIDFRGMHREMMLEMTPYYRDRGERLTLEEISPEMFNTGMFGRRAEETVTEPKEEIFKVEATMSWNGDGRSKFVKATEEVLLPCLKKNIAIHVPHGGARRAESDGRFHIFIWSVLETGAKTVTHSAPYKIWGIDVDFRTETFSPSGKGIVIYDDEFNEIAELIDFNNLFIFYDICHRGTDREISIFKKILERVVVELRMTPSERDRESITLSQKKKEAQRRKYIQECSKRHEKNVEATTESIRKGKKDISGYQKKLILEIRRVQGLERKLDQLINSYDTKSEEEKLGKEFDKILSMEKIRDVTISGGVISIFTDVLYCTDPRSGVEHEIGAFRIDINTDGEDEGVHWFNQTHRIRGFEDGMNAPHVFAKGHACLGNMTEVIPAYIANYEFAVVAIVAIQFIENVNTDDGAGKYINKWPVSQRYRESHPSEEEEGE
ncbi:MAG: hypothetical protein WC788_05370 [Candidatus Paceibacterota bacterium]|jgi:hypothetical protein